MLRNGLGDDLTSVQVSMAGCSDSAEASGDDSWNDGAVLGGADGVTLTACSNGAVDSRFKGDVSVTYTTAAGVSHTKTGTVTAKVE